MEKKFRQKGNFLTRFFVQLKKEDIFATAFLVNGQVGQNIDIRVGPVVQFG